jgi:hypothetical protein
MLIRVDEGAREPPRTEGTRRTLAWIPGGNSVFVGLELGLLCSIVLSWLIDDATIDDAPPAGYPKLPNMVPGGVGSEGEVTVMPGAESPFPISSSSSPISMSSKRSRGNGGNETSALIAGTCCLTNSYRSSTTLVSCSLRALSAFSSSLSPAFSRCRF